MVYRFHSFGFPSISHVFTMCRINTTSTVSLTLYNPLNGKLILIGHNIPVFCCYNETLNFSFYYFSDWLQSIIISFDFSSISSNLFITCHIFRWVTYDSYNVISYCIFSIVSFFLPKEFAYILKYFFITVTNTKFDVSFVMHGHKNSTTVSLGINFLVTFTLRGIALKPYRMFLLSFEYLFLHPIKDSSMYNRYWPFADSMEMILCVGFFLISQNRYHRI